MARLKSFQGLYLALGVLKDLVEEAPADAGETTIAVLGKALRYPGHRKASKAYFLYREAATTLISLIAKTPNTALRKSAVEVYQKGLKTVTGSPLLAMAEAAGGLPFSLSPPVVPDSDLSDIPVISFQSPLIAGKIRENGKQWWLGRSLVAESDDNRLLILKLAKAGDDPVALNNESFFMDTLGEMFRNRPDFTIPVPLKSGAHYLFSIPDLPIPTSMKGLHKDSLCIVYFADPDYFVYPNEPNQGEAVDEASFLAMIKKNSRLLGELSVAGLVHTAPVPLFHNRVQQSRRNDGGLYLWEKGGRLDRWLESCRYPNFGKSGVRDFEHLLCCRENSVGLYKQIGSHLLALFLVTGSFFRNIGRDGADTELTGRVGYDSDGAPLDTRELFCRELLQNALKSIVVNYYEGFTGIGFPYSEIPETEILADEMIREMGVDTHMDEVFRVADQEGMPEEAFIAFLKERGLRDEILATLRPGDNDIVTRTGPHLGGFNQKFSIPGLTDFIAFNASLCISGKYLGGLQVVQAERSA